MVSPLGEKPCCADVYMYLIFLYSSIMLVSYGLIMEMPIDPSISHGLLLSGLAKPKGSATKWTAMGVSESPVL